MAREVTADWDDVDAALYAALDDGEMAVVRASLMGTSYTALSPWCRVYQVRSISDAAGTVAVAMDWRAEPDARGARPITVRCDLDGPSGSESEARFLKAFSRRLAQLAGVETRPLE